MTTGERPILLRNHLRPGPLPPAHFPVAKSHFLVILSPQELLHLKNLNLPAESCNKESLPRVRSTARRRSGTTPLLQRRVGDGEQAKERRRKIKMKKEMKRKLSLSSSLHLLFKVS